MVSITSTTLWVPYPSVYLKDPKIHKRVTASWKFGIKMTATNNGHQVKYNTAYVCVSSESPKPGLLVRIETKATRATPKIIDISPTTYEHS